MKIGKLLSCLLALVMLFTASADSTLDGFIELYNYYAEINGAPSLDSADFLYMDGWYAEIGSGAIGFTFDEDGYTDYLLLETTADDSNAIAAFLNAWFVSDSNTVYSELSDYVYKCIAAGKYIMEAHGNWMFACEQEDGVVMLGIVWFGGSNDTAEATPTPSPSATPAASATGSSGKPINKA